MPDMRNNCTQSTDEESGQTACRPPPSACNRIKLSGHCSGHLPAFFRAAVASRGAALAVLSLMSTTFLSARLTDVGAEATDVVDETRVARHVGRRHEANGRAVSIQSNAIGHGGHIVLVKTGSRAMLAFLSAFEAGPDAGLVLLVCHDGSP